jgi:antitoxin (DNA-binding transcriptional repressor) of toxin-antitoxin stability system
MRMSSVGVRELKEHTGEIVRRARDSRESVANTYRGKVVARIVPEHTEESVEAFEDRWKGLMQLAEEIGKHWPKDVTSADAIAEGRR